MRQRSAVSLLALLSAALLSPLLSPAQRAPAWTTTLDASTANERLTHVLSAGDDAYVAGVIDGDPTAAAYVARLDASFAEVWTLTLDGPQGGNLAAAGLVERDGDSLAVFFVESVGLQEAGAPFLAYVSKLTGEAGPLRRLGLPSTAAYTGLVVAPLPNGEDIALAATRLTPRAGEQPSLDDVLARVSLATGAATWINDDLATAPTARYEPIRQLRAAGEAIYLLRDRPTIESYAPADGSALGAPVTVAEGESRNLANVVSSRSDTLYWVNVSDSLRVTQLVDGRAVRTVPVGAPVDGSLPRELFALAIDDDGLRTYGGLFGDFSTTRLSRSGERLAIAETESASAPIRRAYASPQSSALTADGRLLLVGTRPEPGSILATDGALGVLRASRDGVTAETPYVFGDPTAPRSHVYDILPREDGAVSLLYEGSDVQLRVRTFDREGSPVSDVPFGSLSDDHGGQGFAGAIAVSDGFVALGFRRADRRGTASTLSLLRVSLAGVVTDSVELGRYDGFAAARFDGLIADEGGYAYAVFTATSSGGTPSTRIIRFGPDLSVGATLDLAMTGAPDLAGVVTPIDGSADLYISSVLRRGSTDATVVARLAADGTLVWETALDVVEGQPASAYALDVLSDGRLGVGAGLGNNGDFYAAVLEPDGRIAEEAIFETDAGSGTTVRRVDYAGAGAPILLDYAVDYDAASGLSRGDWDLVRVDVASEALVSLGIDYGGTPFTPLRYLEHDGRTYVLGDAHVGLGHLTTVYAFDAELSPARAAVRASASAVHPNPARPGQMVRVDTDAEGARYRLYDALGRRVATVLAQAGRLTVPDVPPGVYRLVGDGSAPSVAALVVE